MSKDDRGAVLQFECDWQRVRDYSASPGLENPKDRIFHLAHCAAWDTLQRGGTFVLVVGNGKVTMIQRPYAEEIEDEDEQANAGSVR